MTLKTADTQADTVLFFPHALLKSHRLTLSTHGKVNFIFFELNCFLWLKKIKITFPLANAKPIMYSQLSLALSLFSFLFALKKYKQKKTCSAPTTKELICNRSHLLVSISQAALSTLGKAHFVFRSMPPDANKNKKSFPFQPVRPIRSDLISGLTAATL